MAARAKHPCRVSTCSNLADAGHSFCPEHERQQAAERRAGDVDKVRKKRYNTAAWRKIRAAYLRSNPFCELCRDEGRYEKATDVHHKVELSQGGTNAWDNLQALCHACHSRITLGSNRKKGLL